MSSPLATKRLRNTSTLESNEQSLPSDATLRDITLLLAVKLAETNNLDPNSFVSSIPRWESQLGKCIRNGTAAIRLVKSKYYSEVKLEPLVKLELEELINEATISGRFRRLPFGLRTVLERELLSSNLEEVPVRYSFETGFCVWKHFATREPCFSVEQACQKLREVGCLSFDDVDGPDLLATGIPVEVVTLLVKRAEKYQADMETIGESVRFQRISKLAGELVSKCARDCDRAQRQTRDLAVEVNNDNTLTEAVDRVNDEVTKVVTGTSASFKKKTTEETIHAVVSLYFIVLAKLLIKHFNPYRYDADKAKYKLPGATAWLNEEDTPKHSEYLGHNITTIAADKDGKPFMVYGVNTVKETQTPIHHAEMRWIEYLSQWCKKNDIKYKDATGRCFVFTSLESCQQCSGGLSMAQADKVVYAMLDKTINQVGKYVCYLTGKPVPISAAQFMTEAVYDSYISGDGDKRTHFTDFTKKLEEGFGGLENEPYWREGDGRDHKKEKVGMTEYLCTKTCYDAWLNLAKFWNTDHLDTTFGGDALGNAVCWQFKVKPRDEWTDGATLKEIYAELKKLVAAIDEQYPKRCWFEGMD